MYWFLIIHHFLRHLELASAADTVVENYGVIKKVVKQQIASSVLVYMSPTNQPINAHAQIGSATAKAFLPQ